MVRTSTILACEGRLQDGMTVRQKGSRSYKSESAIKIITTVMKYVLRCAYFRTASFVVDSTAASSFIKCGLFPVFSNCSITPITISSLIPSVSTFTSPTAPGEGGGVCSYAVLPLLLGRSAKVTDLEAVDVLVSDRGLAGVVCDAVSDVCDRFIFFVGGCWASVAIAGFEIEGR